MSPDMPQCLCHVLQVMATDQGGNGRSSRADVILTVTDANDNAPTFSAPSAFYSSAEASPGSVLGHVAAVDNDLSRPNNHVIYVLERGGFGKFRVDLESGQCLRVGNTLRSRENLCKLQVPFWRMTIYHLTIKCRYYLSQCSHHYANKTISQFTCTLLTSVLTKK